MSPHVEDNQEIREYLLGGLSHEVLRQVEERLMTEDGFFDELLLVEEGLIDNYVGGQLSPGERRRFEEHFLSTPERQRQLRFAQAFSRYVSNSSEKSEAQSARAEGETGAESAQARLPAPSPAPERAGWFSAFWGNRNWALATMALALIVMAGSWLWLSRTRTTPPRTFATLTLAASAADRAEGVQAAKVTLTPDDDALRIFLMLPEGSAPAARYRAELVNGNGETKSFEAAGQDSRSVSVVITSAQLARGQYALKLFKTEAGGAEQRVPGSYFFNVE
jgi:anti-sigma factor RsiW